MSYPCESLNVVEYRQNCSLVFTNKVKHLAPLHFAVPIYGYVIPFVVLITLVANCLVISILSKKPLRTSTNIILVCMAFTEAGIGISNLPTNLWLYTFKGYDSYFIPKVWCNLIPIGMDTLPSIFHCCAIWLNVFLAVQRYVFVCAPIHISRRYCTIPITRGVISGLLFSSIIFQIPKCLAQYQTTINFPTGNGTMDHVCIIKVADWVNLFGRGWFFGTHHCVSTLFIQVIPLFVLLVFTSLLINYVRSADTRRRTLTAREINRQISGMPNVDGGRLSVNHTVVQQNNTPTSPRECDKSVIAALKRKRSSRRSYSDAFRVTQAEMRRDSEHRADPRRQYFATTRMLIVIMVIFLLVELPAATTSVIHYVHVVFYPTKKATGLYHVMNSLLIFRNLLILISHPFNFIVYCSMSKQFRLTVRQLFTRQCEFEQVIPIVDNVYNNSNTARLRSSKNCLNNNNNNNNNNHDHVTDASSQESHRL